MSNVQQIPLESIDPPKFNSRLNVDGAEIDKLALSLKLRGQDTPITVASLGDGRYELVAGSRRVAAARKLEWTHITADVKGNAEPAANALTNAVENLQRKDLTTYETARVVAHLRSLNLKGKDIKEQTGLSESHISNLAVCFERLPENIKTLWQDQHPAADVGFMRNLITYKNGDNKTVERSPEEISKLWNEKVAALNPPEADDDDDDDNGDDGDGSEKGSDKANKETKGGPPEPPYRVQPERYRRLVKALRNAKAPSLAIDACKYLVGEAEKVKGLTLGDDKKPTKKTDKTKEGK